MITKKNIITKIDDLEKEFKVDTSNFASEVSDRLNNFDRFCTSLLNYLELDVVKEKVVENDWLEGDVIKTKYTIIKAKKSKKAKK